MSSAETTGPLGGLPITLPGSWDLGCTLALGLRCRCLAFGLLQEALGEGLLLELGRDLWWGHSVEEQKDIKVEKGLGAMLSCRGLPMTSWLLVHLADLEGTSTILSRQLDMQLEGGGTMTSLVPSDILFFSLPLCLSLPLSFLNSANWEISILIPWLFFFFLISAE